MSELSEVTSLATSPPKRKTSFARDVVKLVSGTAFAQLLMILAAPLLTRLYTPEAFGQLALFVSITNILTVIACLRYELSIMLPESDEEAANLLAVSLLFAVLISVLTITVVWWGGEPLSRVLNAPGLTPYLWLAPLAVLIGGVFLALNYWNSRTKHFGRLSIARVTSSLATVSMQLGTGYAGYATGGSLIAASLTGQTMATTVLGGRIWRDDRKLLLRAIRLKEMIQGIKRHRKFPMFDVWSAILNTLSWQLPTFLLAAFFSTTVAGFYALGDRLLKVPMSLIGASIAQVFFQRAASAKRDGTLSVLVETLFERLVAIGLFPLLLLTFIGSDLFAVVFGKDWEEAGVYVQILSIWTFFWFISSPLSTLFSVLEKQEFLFVWNAINLVTRFISLIIGGVLQNARMALAIFAISGIIAYGYLSLAIMVRAGVRRLTVFRILFSYLMKIAPVGLILLFMSFFSDDVWITIGVSVLLLIGYFFIFKYPCKSFLEFFFSKQLTNKALCQKNHGPGT